MLFHQWFQVGQQFSFYLQIIIFHVEKANFTIKFSKAYFYKTKVNKLIYDGPVMFSHSTLKT